ncbi:hypothetical protein KY313_02990 [Candidatus Woesearchaeota archaeon]|jgi:hypothetical protein|nr:hypothetical protein [Candidatus Woesearchaeota archaeon]
MTEVDTIFTIKQPYALFRIFRKIFSEHNIEEAKDFEPFVKKYSHIPFTSKNRENLKELLEEIIDNANNEKKSGRFNKYELFETEFFHKIQDKGYLKNKIPILVNGLSIDEKGIRDGIDPYSNSFIFSNHLLELKQGFDEEFLNRLLFMYIQPTTYTQLFKKTENGFALEDLLFEECNRLNEDIKGIGFGTLQKTDSISPKIGNSRYKEILFDIRPVKRSITKSPSTWVDDVYEKGKFGSVKEFLHHYSHLVYLNKTMMAMKWNYYLNDMGGEIKKTLDDYNLKGLPLFMEKTSAAADIIKKATKFSKYKLPLHFIGGKQGILAGKMLFRGIHEEVAFHRLVGFLDRIKAIEENKYVRTHINIPKPKIKKIEYNSTKLFPWILLEENIHNAHPNMKDMAQSLLTDKEIDIIGNFARHKEVGFCRIEPRLVELFEYQGSIYEGRRSQNKLNLSWQQELKGKNIVFPYQLKEFFGKNATFLKDQVIEPITDFRGSEFSLPSHCSIQKLISTTIKDNAYDILEYIIGKYDNILDQFYDKETKQPIAALRGIKLHEITLKPFDDLVHYNTLKELNLDPVPSDQYCEIAFHNKVSIPNTDKECSISFHPDALLFLKDQKERYDIIILDTKTNRVTPYPEVKYLMQTAFYGLMIKDIVEKNGLETNNIYTVLNKNAFDHHFFVPGNNEITHNNIGVFRPQKFSPITKFSPEDPFLDYVMQELHRAVTEKEELRNNDKQYLIGMKKDMQKKHNCDTCYFEQKTICDYITLRGNKNLTELTRMVEKS